MTDHESEARLVAEALGGQVTCFAGIFGIEWVDEYGVSKLLAINSRADDTVSKAVLRLARRLRETEQERDEVESRLVGMNLAWVRDLEAKRAAEAERDELRGVVRGLEEALKLAASGRETGPSGCMVAEPRDHITGGYAVTVIGAAASADRRLSTLRAVAQKKAAERVASVPELRDAQNDFGRRTRRDG